MWEKKKVSVGNSANPQECAFCERPKCIVLCFNCGHTMNNSRVRLVCSDHPKALFLMDINACPNCKINGQLKECLPEELNEYMETAPTVPISPTPLPPSPPVFASTASPPLFTSSPDAPTFVQNVDTSGNSGIDYQPFSFNSGAQENARKGRGRGRIMRN